MCVCIYHLLSNQTSPKWTRAFVIWSWHSSQNGLFSIPSHRLSQILCCRPDSHEFHDFKSTVHTLSDQGISSTNGSKNGETHHWPVAEIVKRSQMSRVQCQFLRFPWMMIISKVSDAIAPTIINQPGFSNQIYSHQKKQKTVWHAYCKGLWTCGLYSFLENTVGVVAKNLWSHPPFLKWLRWPPSGVVYVQALAGDKKYKKQVESSASNQAVDNII